MLNGFGRVFRESHLAFQHENISFQTRVLLSFQDFYTIFPFSFSAPLQMFKMLLGSDKEAGP